MDLDFKDPEALLMSEDQRLDEMLEKLHALIQKVAATKDVYQRMIIHSRQVKAEAGL